MEHFDSAGLTNSLWVRYGYCYQFTWVRLVYMVRFSTKSHLQLEYERN